MRVKSVLKAHIPSGSGNQKAQYITVGILFIDDNGRDVIKLDSLPLSKEWKGWINCFLPKDKEFDSPMPIEEDPKGLDDDIPF